MFSSVAALGNGLELAGASTHGRCGRATVTTPGLDVAVPVRAAEALAIGTPSISWAWSSSVSWWDETRHPGHFKEPTRLNSTDAR